MYIFLACLIRVSRHLYTDDVWSEASSFFIKRYFCLTNTFNYFSPKYFFCHSQNSIFMKPLKRIKVELTRFRGDRLPTHMQSPKYFQRLNYKHLYYYYYYCIIAVVTFFWLGDFAHASLLFLSLYLHFELFLLYIVHFIKSLNEQFWFWNVSTLIL